MEADKLFKLEIVTPGQKLVDKKVKYVSAPGTEGEFGVLAGHTEFLTTLKPGQISYETPEGIYFVAVSWGYAEVKPDSVVILAESAETAEDIDLEKAKKDREFWEKKLAEVPKDDELFKVYEAELDKVLAWIDIATRMGK